MPEKLITKEDYFVAACEYFDIEPDFDWYKRGACIGVDPDIFFPSRGSSSTVVPIAKKICASCEVKTLCLAEGTITSDGGIWGGECERSRKDIRKAFKKHLGLGRNHMMYKNVERENRLGHIPQHKEMPDMRKNANEVFDNETPYDENPWRGIPNFFQTNRHE